jgi:signal transduction histidine kinase
LIQETVKYFTPEAIRKDQTIRVDIKNKIPLIYADGDYIQQVIFNLVDNASKFTRRKGLITIQAEQKDGAIVVGIIDTGCGMDKDEQKYLFEPYYKNIRKKKEHLGGLGLGLALSRIFIELHKGKIWFNSIKGQGSTFYFSLPIETSFVPVNKRSAKYTS